MLFAGARWRTGLERASEPEAVLVHEGRIVAVGGWRELRDQAPGEAVIDLGGAVALPGLIDAHGHLVLLGEAADQIELRAARSSSDVAELVSRAPRHRGWVRGRAWNDALWPSPADARALDGASRGDHVLLDRSDSHAVWVSSSVLALAGITRDTPDPEGGRIERRADGTPNGVLVDRAAERVERLLPEETDADLDRQMRLAAERCAAAGLTSIHDAGLDARTWASLQRLEAAGALPIRVYGMERENDPEVEAVLAQGPQLPGPHGRLTLRTVKLFLDGALGSRGAAFFEPYADGLGGSGLLLETLEDLTRTLTRRMRQGFQVALHAIGDRANALAIDAIEAAVRESGAHHLRPRIEHAQHLRPSDIGRMAGLGIIASMQPSHQASDWPWARERVGAARFAGSYAWRSMLRSGVRLAFGSDFPIESEAPLGGLRAAIERQQEVNLPDESLSAAEALSAFTRGAAYAAFEETQAGLLAPGFRADFSVLSGDPFTERPGQLRALATVVDGQPSASLAAWGRTGAD